MTRSRALPGLAGLLIWVSLAETLASSRVETPQFLRRARLESPPPLGARGLFLGSLFSDLFRDPQDPYGVFWAVTDRGPNGEVPYEGGKRRTFAHPEFSPAIVQVRVQGRSMHVGRVLPLRGQGGAAITGLPNRPGVDETPYDCQAKTVLSYDPAGLDPEGIVRMRSGDFWLAEEYGPSLVRVNSEGVVKERLVPKGAEIRTNLYPVQEVLPAAFVRRSANRGFESLALSRDQRWLYVIIQSPLANPDAATGKISRIARVLKLDAATGAPFDEFVFVLEPATVLGATAQNDVKVSGAVWLEKDRLLIDQRTDEAAMIFDLDLRGATDFLGSKWDQPGHPAIESLDPADLARAGLVPARTRLVANLSSLVSDLPAKIEGLALIDASTLVVGNDNEFAFDGCDAQGRVIPVARPSELLFFRFSAPRR